MVPVVEACAECTQNCLLMHKKDKNPSPVATTFFKVMFGDDFSEVLFLPPRFARSVQNMVGKTIRLEDSSGENWNVKFTRIDGLLAFEEGWNAFSSAHGLKVGDFLVFHYIMESHFVVLMYGQSGCPELRHLGFTRHQMKDSRKKHKVITDDHSPSNQKTNGHLSHESSRSEPAVYEVDESGKVLEKLSEEPREKPKKSTRMPSEATYNNPIKKRLRNATLPITQPKMAKIEPVGEIETDTSGSRLHNVGSPSASTRMFPKPIAKPMEVTKKEPTLNRGSYEEDDVNLPNVKSEPVDEDDEAPPHGATNTLFSATMSSYQYLELPEWVELKPKVILLRNGADLWPVLYQKKVGLKALTQSWEVFAKERGIQPGDKCEFVLESEPSTKCSCSVFRVDVTCK